MQYKYAAVSPVASTHTSHTNIISYKSIESKIAEKNIVNDGFSFPQYKRNGIFKKYKIENNNINNSPNIIEYNRKKSAGITSYRTKQSKQEITKPNPQIKFNQLYIE